MRISPRCDPSFRFNAVSERLVMPTGRFNESGARVQRTSRAVRFTRLRVVRKPCLFITMHVAVLNDKCHAEQDIFEKF